MSNEKSPRNDWADDAKSRAKFWATIKETGLSKDQVHEALEVASIYDYDGSVTDAIDGVKQFADVINALAQLPAISDAPDLPERMLAIAGARDEVVTLAKRMQGTVPGVKKLSWEGALTFAQYVLATRLNPWSGELQVWEDKQGLHVMEHYKVFTRWANKISPFSTLYELLGQDSFPFEARADDYPDHIRPFGVRGWLLRDDRRHVLKDYIDMGFDEMTAFKLTAVEAISLMTRSDQWNLKGNYAKFQVKTWNVEQAVKKNCLRGMIKLAYPIPTLDELAQLSHEVDGTVTIPADWMEAQDALEGTLDAGNQELTRRLAAMAADTRQIKADARAHTPEEAAEVLARNRALLHPDTDAADRVIDGEVVKHQESEPDPRDLAEIVAKLREAAGWENGRKESDETAQPPEEWLIDETTNGLIHAMPAYVVDEVRPLAITTMFNLIFERDDDALTAKEWVALNNWLWPDAVETIPDRTLQEIDIVMADVMRQYLVAKSA